MNNVRRGEAIRKEEILQVALRMAQEFGYQKITRDDLAERCRCSTGIVTKYFGTMQHLRRAVISAAIAHRDLQVLAQGLANNEAKAHAAPESLRRDAMEYVIQMGGK